MADIQSLTKKILKFRDDRDWKQFHLPKDTVLSLMLEVAELAEHMQWKSTEEFKEYLKENRDAVGDELVDILYWVLLMSADFEIDLEEAFSRKMQKNADKYPIDKACGSSRKYDEL